MMLAAGTAETQRGAIALSPAVVVPVASSAQMRSDLQYLFERPHLCPVEGKAARAAWALTLQLRSGDLSAWDENALRLLRELLDQREFAAAAGVIEAHALASSRTGTGPPGAEALLMARGLGLVLWPPRRQRRLFRMWLRGYRGEWRPMLLALQAQAERAARAKGSPAGARTGAGGMRALRGP
jgi:hypothetical protein